MRVRSKLNTFRATLANHIGDTQGARSPLRLVISIVNRDGDGDGCPSKLANEKPRAICPGFCCSKGAATTASLEPVIDAGAPRADTQTAGITRPSTLAHPTAPLRSRRSTMPGKAPVWVACSTTSVPLTMTPVRLPLGKRCGSA